MYKAVEVDLEERLKHQKEKGEERQEQTVRC
jgi:hypothetical protein